MDFSFSTTAGTSQSTSKPRLEGNDIYTVKFDGCEIKDVQGVKDPTAVYKQIILKFINDDGVFEHTVWEPRPEDFNRRETDAKDSKTGLPIKIKQPSNVESMMLLFKHAADTLNPAIAKQIDSKEKNLSAPNWDALRKLVMQILDAGKGKETKIKLLKNTKTGEAQIPGFYAGLTKEGVAYVKNNFIGDKVAFSTYELDRINKERSAAPARLEPFTASPNTEDETPELNMDFNIDGL